jgi:photosystem II stability/assembly factor-like uncharacterized protein
MQACHGLLTGYLCGSNGKIFKTSDGGETWLESPWDFSNYYSSDLFFTNIDTGFIDGTFQIESQIVPDSPSLVQIFTLSGSRTFTG